MILAILTFIIQIILAHLCVTLTCHKRHQRKEDRPTKSHAPGVRLTPQRLISRPPAQHPQSHASGKAGEIRKLLVIFALFCPKTQKISGLNVDRAL